VAQRNHGIDLARAPRWKVPGCQCHASQKQGDDHKDSGISWANIVEQTGHEAREFQSCRNSYDHSQQSEDGPFADDLSENLNSTGLQLDLTLHIHGLCSCSSTHRDVQSCLIPDAGSAIFSTAGVHLSGLLFRAVLPANTDSDQ